MKRDEIKSKFPDVSDALLDYVMTQNGADIEKVKAKLKEAEETVSEKQKALDDLTAELGKLKDSNATAEDFKAKFEALQKDVAEKERVAKEESAKKEKAEAISKRFDAVLGDKKFKHSAIKDSYLRKFEAALDDSANASKSDSEILFDLTKDDGDAFKGVEKITLAGANSDTKVNASEVAQARAVMGLPPIK